jgi:hypothetical protein
MTCIGLAMVKGYTLKGEPRGSANFPPGEPGRLVSGSVAELQVHELSRICSLSSQPDQMNSGTARAVAAWLRLLGIIPLEQYLQNPDARTRMQRL